ncbi:peroxisome assembly protein (Peroxin-2) [Gaertneriomyces sp. JEL0708]|nr:peroxisome assembly protein (Peroxin-2) [Gaertneriomyces sp. JEL0708]
MPEHDDSSQSIWSQPELAASGAPNSSDPSAPKVRSILIANAARRALSLSTSAKPFRLRILRVAQLDAELLDAELAAMMKDQVLEVFKLYHSNIKERFEPEITAVLQYVMCRLSIYSMGASYGLQLQNLKYRNEARHQGQLESFSIDAPLTRIQKIAHALLFVGGRWGWLRINRYSTTHGWSERSDDDWRSRLYELLQKAETVYRIASLINFLVFLYNGRYRSILDRLLRMRLVYTRREMSRQVSFEFMNRQLVWHAFTEFLLFLAPLINIDRIKARIGRIIASPVTVDLPDHICAICHSKDVENPTVHTPYVTNCGHRYCYYCIKTSMMVDHNFPCPRCGHKVETISREED